MKVQMLIVIFAIPIMSWIIRTTMLRFSQKMKLIISRKSIKKEKSLSSSSLSTSAIMSTKRLRDLSLTWTRRYLKTPPTISRKMKSSQLNSTKCSFLLSWTSRCSKEMFTCKSTKTSKLTTERSMVDHLKRSQTRTERRWIRVSAKTFRTGLIWLSLMATLDISSMMTSWWLGTCSSFSRRLSLTGRAHNEIY